jgi:CheY-like chemotaxis protein
MASVLVVDDDPQLRVLLRRLLARQGYAVACAASGAEALGLLREFLPDLVILDWMMPGLDGGEVLRRMAADPTMAAVRVMVYTASNDASVEREAIRLGACACVQKGRTHGRPPGADRVLPELPAAGGTRTR